MQFAQTSCEAYGFDILWELLQELDYLSIDSLNLQDVEGDGNPAEGQ